MTEISTKLNFGTIEEKIKDAIVDKLGIKKEEITRESRIIDDLGADSLDVVELVMELEEKFSIEIPDEEAEKLKTVEDIVKYIETHQKS